MDRVLLIIDDIQYSRHVEMTLRKVGFDVESITNEFNMAETILTFNPDYIICRGNTNRLSVHSVGRKLKDASTKFFGKVLLIFPTGYKITPDDVTKLRMDLMLFDPLSTLKLAMHLFSFSHQDFESVRDKLLKFAITDTVFRSYEQQILKSEGRTIDSEIQIISNMKGLPETAYSSQTETLASEIIQEKEFTLKEPAKAESQSEIRIEQKPDYWPASEPSFPEPENFSEEAIAKLSMEIQAVEEELPLRIDTYNHAAKETEVDLNVGLKKRQTRSENTKLHVELINQQKTDEKREKRLHDEKVRFAQALFKKKS